ncbi:hypothetical protein GOP47_0026933 [Adiantum capillus-veneris]|nr:hypothetical protein GOP47_0026933 [Adiantum capillus-veneris]
MKGRESVVAAAIKKGSSPQAHSPSRPSYEFPHDISCLFKRHFPPFDARTLPAAATTTTLHALSLSLSLSQKTSPLTCLFPSLWALSTSPIPTLPIISPCFASHTIIVFLISI